VDALSFVVEMVKALAWPIMVLVLVLLLRRPIAQLVPLLTRLKYKDLELEFGRRVAEVTAEAGEELPPPHKRPFPEAAADQILGELAGISPRAAVTEAWRQVEVAAVDAAVRNDIHLSPTEATSPARVLRALERHRVIDAGKLGLVHDLRGLRNQAVHSPEFAVTRAAALEYTLVARRMVDFLATARRGEVG